MAKEGNGIVDKIYPTRVGGHEFFSGDTNLGSNGQFDPDGTLVSEGSGVYHLTDYSAVRMTAYPETNYPTDSIGGCNMNFADTAARGFGMRDTDWKDIEMTEYVNFTTASPSDAEIIMKGPTGHHPQQEPCCQGAAYGIRTGTESQVNSEFFKEEWHVSYDSRGFKNIPTSVHNGSFKDGNWHGIKFMNYEVMVGSKKCRKLEHWIDADGDGTGWVKVNETIDQGGMSSNGGTCHGASDQIITWANGRVNWRFDLTSTNMKFKWLSCREIDINGNPDQGGGGGGTGGGSPSIAVDGVAKIYPDKPNGFVWYMDNAKPFDGHLEKGGGSSYSNLVKNGDGSWKPNSDGTIKFNIETDPAYQDAIGGCKNDYSANMQRGYSYKTNFDLDHVEMTAFFRMTSQIDHDGIYMRGPCNHHPGSPCCEEYDYDVRVKPGSSAFVVHTKDHPDAANNFPEPGVGKKTITFAPDTSTFFGIKYVHIIVSSDPATPRVRLECYINRNGDKITWEKISTAEDFKGKNWGTNSAVCGGEPYQVLAWRSPRMVIKWYNGHVDFKLWSIRQIDPTGTFENPPPEPCPAGQHRDSQGNCVPDSTGGGGGSGGGGGEPTRVRGFLRFLWDINTVSGGSACQGTGGGGGGGSGTLGKVYEVAAVDANTKSLSNSTTFNHRTRIVQVISSGSSTLVPQIAKQIDVPLKKAGLPTAANSVRAKIWSSSGGVIYTSPTILDPSTLTTSYVSQTFDFTTNTHPFANGDRIGVEYTGTSDTNYVIGTYDADSIPNSYMSNFEGTTWDNHTDRDMAITIWT